MLALDLVAGQAKPKAATEVIPKHGGQTRGLLLLYSQRSYMFRPGSPYRRHSAVNLVCRKVEVLHPREAAPLLREATVHVVVADGATMGHGHGSKKLTGEGVGDLFSRARRGGGTGKGKGQNLLVMTHVKRK